MVNEYGVFERTPLALETDPFPSFNPPFHTALLVNRGGYTAGSQSLAAALLAEAGLKPPPVANVPLVLG